MIEPQGNFAYYNGLTDAKIDATKQVINQSGFICVQYIRSLYAKTRKQDKSTAGSLPKKHQFEMKA